MLLQKVFPKVLIVAVLALVSLLFYYPLISGKVLVQSDIQQYKSMGRQIAESRSETPPHETYWIDNAFMGMPTYQLGARYPADFLQPFYYLTRFLPRPANLLFLYLLSAFVLFSVIGLQNGPAFLGSISFGFSTYLLIILQVGHNTKAEAIGYFPLVLAGFLLLIQNKRLWGWVLSVLALGMQIRANHYQMTYYLLLFLGVLGLVYALAAFRNKQLPSFLTQMGLFVTAGLLALGLNATPLLATAEYSEFSTRGSSELRQNADGTPKVTTEGLDYEYITQYSYGIFESFSLLFPRIQGGGSRENLGTDSPFYSFLIRAGVPRSQAAVFCSAVPTYWGDQPILEAPAYIGICVAFLALLGFFSSHGPLRNGLALGIGLSLLLSWGKNIPWLTQTLIDYFPLYNKFRAVSSAQVILELCTPILAVWGLTQFWLLPSEQQKKQLLRTTMIFGALIAALFVLQGMLSFQGIMDTYLRQAYGAAIFDQIVQARKDMYSADLLRGVIFIALISGVLYGKKLGKIPPHLTLLLLVGIVAADLLQVSSRYIDRELFVPKRMAVQAFQPTEADKTILNDSSYFRVFDSEAQLNSARTAYFHHTLGGYHGAKPKRLQEVIDFFNAHRAAQVLNMLNVKYVLYTDEDTQKVLINPEAQGVAWPVDSLLVASNDDEALQRLKDIDISHKAVLSEKALPADFPMPKEIDTTFQISLTQFRPDSLQYTYRAEKDQLVVFSESYYKNGWKARVNGNEIPLIRVNHLLRAAWLPANANTVTFTFEPGVIAQGTRIRWASLLVFFICVGGGMWYQNRHKST